MSTKSSFKLVLILTAVCFAGCHEPHPAKPSSSRNLPLDTPAGMIEYLNSRNLPALKAVDIWQNQYAPGIMLTTDHYQFYTTFLEPLMLSQVPGFLESAFRAYNAQLSQIIEPTFPFTVYLFADRDQWEDFTDSFTGKNAVVYKKIQAGAYYLNGSCVAYNIGRERTFSVLAHEGWHQFNSRLFKYRLPSWLDEGIAMLFESHRYEDGFFYFEPGRNTYRLAGLKKILAEKKMMPIRHLIGTNPGEVLARDDADSVTAFYSQSYALVRFLREEKYGRRLGNYHSMLLAALEGTWPLEPAEKAVAINRNIPRTVSWNRSVATKLFEIYIGDDFENIEKEYLAFCRKIVYHVKARLR